VTRWKHPVFVLVPSFCFLGNDDNHHTGIVGGSITNFDDNEEFDALLDMPWGVGNNPKVHHHCWVFVVASY
jgi:hypothetical protein